MHCRPWNCMEVNSQHQAPATSMSSLVKVMTVGVYPKVSD